ncbi:hypothetical protein [uncultured Helicobacter sp.]|uniref:hypothetical protein n=1 Tax=uncultured Helicobacter sp. TaxID=175537 RepID=UPI00374EBD7D
MDSWHEDLKTDDMAQEFLRFFRALMPNDRDLFYKLLEEEYKEIKKTQEMENPEQEQTNEFINDIQEEIKEIKTQAETNEFINDIKQEVTELQAQAETKESINEPQQEAQEIKAEAHTQESSEQTQEPKEQEIDIDVEIARQKQDFIQNNQEELESLELVSNKDSELTLYADQIIFPEQTMQAFKQELQNNPNTQLDSMLTMDKVKENLAKEREFQEVFTQEVASLSDESPSMEKDRKLNPDNYFQDLMNWFDKKKLENENMPLTKKEFKEEFLEYCKSGMSENEMKILLLLANKEPSKLTKEHKDMINDGLKFNLTNAKLLDKGLETAIRGQVGENLINNNIEDFTKSVEKLKNSDNLIDKKMMEGTAQKIANKIADQTPNITQTNSQKLEAIANNKEIPKLQQGKGKSR